MMCCVVCAQVVFRSGKYARETASANENMCARFAMLACRPHQQQEPQEYAKQLKTFFAFCKFLIGDRERAQ